MKHYSKSLDLLLAATQFSLKGQPEKAAKYFMLATQQRDMKATLAGLDKLNADNKARAEAAKAEASTATAKPEDGAKRVAKFLKEHAATRKQVAAKKAGSQTADTDADIFNETINKMTRQEADLDDVLELPEETAGEDNGQGESDLDVGQDDASDLEYSPTEETADEDELDLSDLGDLSDLEEDDFGDDEFGEDVQANTTGEGDVDERAPIPQCSDEVPEGETSPGLPPVPKAEDTDVTTPGGGGGGSSIPSQNDSTKEEKEARASTAVARVNRVNKNLAALSRQTALTQAARVAIAKPKQKPAVK